jgi:hypothetical protein
VKTKPKNDTANMRKMIIKEMAFAVLKKDFNNNDVARILKIFNLWKHNLKFEKYPREQFFRNHKIDPDDKLLINTILETTTCAAFILYP